MTIYYDPQRSMITSSLDLKFASIRIVVKRLEFWMFMLLHVGATVFFSVSGYNLGSFRWEASGAMQFFLTFMLTFYNEHCYERYQDFYYACMDAQHSALLFVHELTVSMPVNLEFVSVYSVEQTTPWYRDKRAGAAAQPAMGGDSAPHKQQELFAELASVEKHRTAACRYILAAVYLFYMSSTGGVAPEGEWVEVERKGLLTRSETQMLKDFPGGRVTLILTSWAMQTVQEVLRKPVFWQTRSHAVHHIHNRLNDHTNKIIVATQKVNYLLSLPIPFMYFHLLNVIMLCNFIILAIGLANYGTFYSMFAYALALAVFMGLREVAVQLTDPFGQDEIDFPVEQFLDYAFDHSIGLLEAFSNPLAYTRVMKALESIQDFTDEEVLHTTKSSILYNPDFQPATDNAFAWDKPMPLQALGELDKEKGAKKVLRNALTKGTIDPRRARHMDSKDNRTDSDMTQATKIPSNVGKLAPEASLEDLDRPLKPEESLQKMDSKVELLRKEEAKAKMKLEKLRRRLELDVQAHQDVVAEIADVEIPCEGTNVQSAVGAGANAVGHSFNHALDEFRTAVHRARTPGVDPTKDHRMAGQAISAMGSEGLSVVGGLQAGRHPHAQVENRYHAGI